MVYLQEWLARLADFLTRIPIDVFFADVRAPRLDELFIQDVGLVKPHEDVGNCGDQLRFVESNELFNPAHECFLVLLRRHHLLESEGNRKDGCRTGNVSSRIPQNEQPNQVAQSDNVRSQRHMLIKWVKGDE